MKIPSLQLPLGVVSNDKQDIKCRHYQVEDGDSIYVFSDGLIEAQNEQDESFGTERLEQCIADSHDGGNTFESILDAVNRFRGSKQQIDDLSLLEINCHDSVVEDDVYWADKQLHRPPMGWEFSIKLETDLIKSLNPLPMIVQLLTDMQGINSYRQPLHTIFSELYLNSLEHGILGLDKNICDGEQGFTGYYMQREKALAELEQGFVEMHVRHKPEKDGGVFVIRIIDSGSGFNFEKMLSGNKDGKGIDLVRSLCDRIEYQQNGNVVEVQFSWHN